MLTIDIKTGLICEYCGRHHDGSYGSGRFCNEKCARAYSSNSMTDEAKARRTESVRRYCETHYKHDTRNHDNYATYKPSKKSNNNRIKSKMPNLINECKKMVGTTGEYAVIKKFLEHGIKVFVPVCDDAKVDCLAYFNGKLQKIQIKTSTRTDYEVTDFTISQSRLGIANNKTITIKYTYSPSEVDYFALYDYFTDEVFLIKNDGKYKDRMRIRYTKTKNNQKKHILFAEDYKFDNVVNYLDICNDDIDDDNYYRIEINA